MNNRTLLMYGVAGEKRPIFSESEAFLHNLDDHTYTRFSEVVYKPSDFRMVLHENIVRFLLNRTLFYTTSSTLVRVREVSEIPTDLSSTGKI